MPTHVVYTQHGCSTNFGCVLFVTGARTVPSPTYAVAADMVPTLTPIQLATPAATPAATKETMHLLGDRASTATPVQTTLVPVKTPAMTKEAVKHLLFGAPELKTPVATVLVPAATDAAPAVVVSGKRNVTFVLATQILMKLLSLTPMQQDHCNNTVTGRGSFYKL